MSLLWAGGEPVCFQNAVTNSGTGRGAGFSRCYIYSTSGVSRSYPFLGGAVTSCWISWRQFTGSQAVDGAMAGLGSANAALFVAFSHANSSKMSLRTYNVSSGASVELMVDPALGGFTTGLDRFDMQVTNYNSTSCSVSLYINGVFRFTWTGDPRVNGATNIDSVYLFGAPPWSACEFMVADEDLRNWPGLLTGYLTGAGTTDQWSGVYSDINGIPINDTNPNNTNTINQDQQFNIADPPSGSNYVSRGAHLWVRATKSGTTPAVNSLALGYNIGGTVTVGSDLALTGAFSPVPTQRLDQTNPLTGLPWTVSELTNLQINVRSRP